MKVEVFILQVVKFMNFQQLSHRNFPSMILSQRIENNKNMPSEPDSPTSTGYNPNNYNWRNSVSR